jgi:hypothetical protein
MPIDPSIALGVQPFKIESPVNQLAQFMQMQGLQQANQLNGMKMDEYQRTKDRQNKMLTLLGGLGQDATDDQRSKVLKGAGYFDEADKIEKGVLDRMKTKSEVDAKDIETAYKRVNVAGQTFKFVSDNPSLENANAAIDHLVTMGIYTPEMATTYKGQVSADPSPANISRMAQLAFRSALDAKSQLPTLTNFNAGDRQVNQAADPVTGKVTETGSTAILESANNVANNKRIAQEGSLNRGVQIRSQNLVDARAKDANRIAEGQLSSGGPVLGAPVPAVLPWANQSNQKDANKVKAAEQQRGAKEIEKDLDAAKKERGAAASAKRFIELNNKTNTGGLVDRMGVTRGLQSLGGYYAEMEAITAQLAPAMRVEGSGSTSDFDGKQFERATVGVDKPKSTNKNIANGVIARAQQAEEYADFRQTYFEQNGTLQGADRFWKDYANKNPIFDPAKDGTFELNKSRKTWKEHFKAGNSASANSLSDSEAAELKALRERLGKK